MSDPEPPPGARAARITDAAPEDASAIADLLVASITRLCEKDHGNDPNLIARWTANKTPQTVLAWIEDPGQRVLVAWEDDRIVSVGALGNGTVHLNYVAPEHLSRGHGKAMLAVMEACLAMIGTTTAHLESTATAHAFYLSQGWVDTGEPRVAFGLPAQPMTKELTR